MDFATIDVEASGTEHDKHSIVSLGAIDFDNPENRFYRECKVWTGAHIMDEALEVNGFTKEQITDPTKMSEGELVAEFMEWSFSMSDRTLVGQNVSFDFNNRLIAGFVELLPGDYQLDFSGDSVRPSVGYRVLVRSLESIPVHPLPLLDEEPVAKEAADKDAATKPSEAIKH